MDQVYSISKRGIGNVKNVLQILYLAHDIYDASVAKRCKMLANGGAEVDFAGFHRGKPPHDIHGKQITDFGPSYNARLGHRCLIILKTCLRFRRYRDLFVKTDVILARNLEMLFIAKVFCKILNLNKPIIYEILDIHTSLTGKTFKSKILQMLEKICLKNAKAVLTSSPAFIENHLQKQLDGSSAHIIIIENKLYPAPSKKDKSAVKLPWRIGWFGMLRCKKSFDILCEVANHFPEDLEIHLAGKPALDQIPDFFESIKHLKNIAYTGPYINPDDLPNLYANIDFCWAIDFYEEGSNSDWLLPNRLYESGYFQVPALARGNTQASTFLKAKKLAIHLEVPTSENLKNLIQNMNTAQYTTLQNEYKKQPEGNWVFSSQDCKELVQNLKNSIGKQDA